MENAAERNRGAVPAVHGLLEHLEREGVRHIFGIPGGPVIGLYDALYDRGVIAPVLAKHEEGAAFMADGYARISGGIGVCCTTAGPGATNALTGVAVAYADHSPVLILTAQVPIRHFGKGAFQESSPEAVDVVELYRPVTKWSTMIHHPEATGPVIRKALRLMTSGRPGPVHINLPCDVMTQMVARDLFPPETRGSRARTFDRLSVKEAASWLLSANRPALLAGHGVNLAQAWGPLRGLAESFGIPVATTFKAKGALAEDHPLSLGVFGYSGSALARDYLLDEADAILVAGTSLGEASSCGWDVRLGKKKALLQIDVDPGAIGRNFPVTVGLVGDAGAVLTEIRFEMERVLRKNPLEFKPRHHEFIRPAKLPTDDSEDKAGLGPLGSRRILGELRRALPRDAALFVDNGTIRTWSGAHFPVLRENSFFVNMGLAGMGFAVAASIGGKLSAPGRVVAALVGDAAFAMNGMEIHTAVEHRVPVVWIVINNGGHGMIYHGERMLYGKKFKSSVFAGRLKIADIARAMGASAFRVDHPGEMAGALRRAFRVGGPCVVDVAADLHEVPPMGARVANVGRALAGVPASA
jgi:acetolactate synthase-1/2/3 large subunit